MKNVLFLHTYFPDLDKGEENLYSDLALEFKRQGQNVFVVTIQDYISGSNNSETELVEQKGIKILRVKTPTKYFNTSFIEKGITTVAIPFLFSNAIKKFFSGVKFDLVMPVSIVPGMYRTIRYLQRRDNSKVYLLLRDLFPQMAQDMGVLPSPLYKYFRKQQIKLYNLSNYIGCCSDANINFVKENLPEVKTEKLVLLPHWRTVRVRKKSSFDFRGKYGLNGKIIAIFGGVLGIQQGLDFLLDLANSVKNSHKDFQFILIGNGTEKDRLKGRIKKEDIFNTIILDRIPSDEYEGALSQCDIGLINLHGDLRVPHIPSKTLSYMEAGIPILAGTDKTTDFNEIIESIGAGFGCYFGDIEKYKENLLKLASKEQRNLCGSNGKDFLLNNWTSEHIYHQIIDTLNAVK